MAAVEDLRASACVAPLTTAYPLAVRYRVRDLARAKHFLSGILDIAVREEGQGYVRLDNGSICLFVVEDQQHADPIAIALAAADVEATVKELLMQEGVRLSQDARWTAPNRYEAELRVDGWLQLVVGRTYNEDELGVLPDLETQLAWEESAGVLLKKLLTRVPVAFRQAARTKSVARSESLAMERGEVVVTGADAVRAIVEVTPKFQHPLLHEALRELDGELGLLSSRISDATDGQP